MYREQPAANILVRAFWAESLIFAEVGAIAGALQIAGTANTHQIQFFVAACDYCLIGEELYAASAYLYARTYSAWTNHRPRLGQDVCGCMHGYRNHFSNL